MRESLIEWKDENGIVNTASEMTWILANKDNFWFFLNKYREEMQHCGASYHAVLTLLKEDRLLCLTIGYLSAHPENVASFRNTTPKGEKCFQKGQTLSAVQTPQDEIKWGNVVGNSCRGTSSAKIKRVEENRQRGQEQQKKGKNTGRFGPHRSTKIK